MLVRVCTFLMLLPLALASCATGPKLVPIENPDQRIEFEGFSVLPPSGTGWGFFGFGYPSTPLNMGKDISRPSHSIVASVTVLVLTTDLLEGRKPSDVLEFIAQGKTKIQLEQDKAKNRFSLVESKTTAREIAGQPCIEWSAKFLDRAAPANPGKVLELTGDAMICQFPGTPSMAVTLEYSERFEPGEAKQHYFDEGRRFMESLQFTPFPYQVTAWKVGKSPQLLLPSRGSLWIADVDDDAVLQFDAAAGKVVQRIPVGHKPFGLLEVPDGILVANSGSGTISHINASGKVTRTLEVGGFPVTISRFENQLAVCNAPKGQITLLDGKTLEITRKIPVGGHLELAWCEAMGQELWAIIGQGSVGHLARIAGGSLQIRITNVGGSSMGMAVRGGSAWVADDYWNLVRRINLATGEKEAEIRVGHQPIQLAVYENEIWVTNVRGGTVSRINPEQGTVAGKALALGVGIAGMAVIGDTLWLDNARSGVLLRIAKK